MAEIKKRVVGVEDYDSTQDTLEHIRHVQNFLNQFAFELVERGRVHDMSKLLSPEKEGFDRETPLLKNVKYGSQEYKDSLARLKDTLMHHYTNNTHHPEYYKNGIEGFDLFDLVEMYCDWKAASMRTKDGNFADSIDISSKRFKLPKELIEIFKNTHKRGVLS